MFTFFYTRNGKVRNEQGQMVDASVDTGISVTLFPTYDDLKRGPKKLQKAMIERFRELNGGELPRFRVVESDQGVFSGSKLLGI